MAFVLSCTLDHMEYRGMRTGTGSKSNQPWMMLVLEDGDAQQCEVSVPRDMQGDVYSLGLRKGDYIMCSVRAVARADGNSYVQLVALPEIYEYEEE